MNVSMNLIPLTIGERLVRVAPQPPNSYIRMMASRLSEANDLSPTHPSVIACQTLFLESLRLAEIDSMTVEELSLYSDLLKRLKEKADGGHVDGNPGFFTKVIHSVFGEDRKMKEQRGLLQEHLTCLQEAQGRLLEVINEKKLRIEAIQVEI